MYHVLVRAVDAAGNLSTSVTTNGITVDIDRAQEDQLL